MKDKANWISLLSLLVIVSALPLYALREQTRLAQARAGLKQTYLKDATHLYVTLCSDCHGSDGNGTANIIGLDNPALAEADPRYLFRKIARASHGTTMAAWHIEEGGVLSSFEVDELVTLIQAGDWLPVRQLAEQQGKPAAMPFSEMEKVFSDAGTAEEAHQCIACHEEPQLHAGLFGTQCAYCHTSTAWTPALLTRHTFQRDHGNEGKVPCETCHASQYVTHSCYGCHEHSPDEIYATHLSKDVPALSDCAGCHPTGEAGDALQQADAQNRPISSRLINVMGGGQ